MDLSSPECESLELPEQEIPCCSKDQVKKDLDTVTSPTEADSYESEDSEDDWSCCDCEGEEALRLEEKKQNELRKMLEELKDGDSSFYSVYKKSIKELEELKNAVEKYKKIELLQGEGEEIPYEECDEKLKYLKEAKTPALNCATIDKYFYDKNLVYKFGTVSLLRVRLGFDPFSGYWRIYIHKPNAEFKPSVVHINYNEVDEFIGLTARLLRKIDNGNVNGVPFLQPDDVMSWKSEKMDNAEYWAKNAYNLESGNLRVRMDWNYGRHNFVLNNPVPVSNIENFFGPKIPMSAKDVNQLIGIIYEIKDKCPDYEIMVDN